MLRTHTLILALLLACVAAGGEELLPRPPGLEPNVRFWKRIYTQVDGDAGLIHDADRLDVVYQELRFPAGLSQRSRDRKVKKAKEQVRAALTRLASGKRTGLSAEDQAVLSRWPRDVSNATLRAAARNVRFQLGQADKFRAGLIRSGAWSDHIRATLTEGGVPAELAALPHVESSYNPKAYSRIGAAGLWQFTRDTGRRYLRVDLVVDERMDPFKSTEAAARLLRDNYQSVQTWPLAITAYNHGASGVRRAVQKLGTRDIDTIVRKYRSRTFGFASRNFYASFLAALEVDRKAERYFGPLQPDAPIEYVLVETPHFYAAKSLEQALGVDLETLRAHNNALRPSVWTGSKHVPRGFALRVPAHLIREPVPRLLAKIPESERLTQQHRDRFYKVQRGDTLSAIARHFGVRESQLAAINNLRSRHRIRAGQVLVLPGAAPVDVRREEPPDDGIYRVRRGDTLSIIARRFETSEGELVALNGLRDRNRIAVGQRLKIPGAATPPSAPGSAASEPVVIASAARETAPAALSPADSQGRAEASAGAEADGRAPSDERPRPPIQPAALETAAPTTPAAESWAPEPSDYAIHANDRITVQADETLGHYAEWLEVRASRLRALNGMRYGQDLVIGRPLRLDLSRVAPEEFERRRLEYHRSLQEEFFDAYVVTGTERHILRRGDTIWELATREYSVPVWLLRQYNPDLDFGALPAGVAMVVPIIEPRNG